MRSYIPKEELLPDFLEAALALAEGGTAVFPVGADKAPLTPRGFHDATTDAARIRAWNWNGGSMIGAAVSAGTVIIDVDPRNGGTETLALFKELGKTFPPTRVVRTRSGGFHYYFSVPEELPLRSSLGPGIDVKRHGKGYVVVPPSPGYAFLSGSAPAEAPAWLLEELEVPEKDPDVDAPSDAKYFPWEKGTAYGLGALERELGRLATQAEGGRNNALNKAAFSMAQLCAGGELDQEHAEEQLAQVALQIGLEPDEARATIASGWKAGDEAPRQAKPRETEDEVTRPQPGGAIASSSVPAEDIWEDWEVEEPPLPFYIRGIIPHNAYVLVFGATEASKSMTFMALGAEASRRGINVSFYSLENPPATDRDRLRRLRPNKAHFRITHEPLDLNDPRQLEAMVEREKVWDEHDGRTDIIVIDTYSHAFNSRSEDGNAKAIEFARCIRHVMAEVGCSVVLIDHTGYAQEDEPRDASAKRQQVDVAVLMKKAGEWRPGAPARFTMINKKAARFANPFSYTGAICDVKDELRGLELEWESADKPKWEDA